MWMMLLIGAAIGAGLTVTVILGEYKVQPKEKWEEFELSMTAQRSLVDALTAETARLRVALAAGEMTEEGKQIAAMTMAALDSFSTVGR